MEVKVINVISIPREITNGKYNLYKFIIDKDIDAVVNGKLTKRNGFGLTEFAIKYYGIKVNRIIGKTIDIDVTYHKAGDTFVNLWGDKDKFKEDCIEVIINKVIKQENYIMKRYFIIPEYADEPWGEADTIEEARAIRDKIARDFISRRVVIIDNDYHEVD